MGCRLKKREVLECKDLGRKVRARIRVGLVTKTYDDHDGSVLSGVY